MRAAQNAAIVFIVVLLMVQMWLLTATLERCNRNVSRAAKELGVESHVLYYKLKTLSIHIAPRSDVDLSSSPPTSQTLSTLRSDERKTKSRAAG